MTNTVYTSPSNAFYCVIEVPGLGEHCQQLSEQPEYPTIDIEAMLSVALEQCFYNVSANIDDICAYLYEEELLFSFHIDPRIAEHIFVNHLYGLVAGIKHACDYDLAITPRNKWMIEYVKYVGDIVLVKITEVHRWSVPS